MKEWGCAAAARPSTWLHAPTCLSSSPFPLPVVPSPTTPSSFHPSRTQPTLSPATNRITFGAGSRILCSQRVGSCIAFVRFCGFVDLWFFLRGEAMQRVLVGGLWGSRSLLPSGVLKYGNGSVSNVRVQSGGGVGCRGLFTQGPVEGEAKDAKEASATSDPERDDMATSYGAAYASRSAEEGFGERYDEAVKAVLEKKEDQAMQEGTTTTFDRVTVEEYDTTQGEPVAQKEVARHSEHHTAFESEKTSHERAEDIGSRGGAAT